MSVPRDLRSDAGSTLVEVLVSLVILSLAGLAILAGLQLSVTTSDIHRKQVSGGAHVRGYAERIEAYLDTTGNYVACASPSDYAPAKVGFIEPPGHQARVVAVDPLAGDGSVISDGCSANDRGVQRLQLTVNSADGRAAETLTIVVRKACGEGTSCG